MNFDTFISTHSTFKKLENSLLARQIYDEIIWTDSNRIKMSKFSDAGKPALAACAVAIEELCLSCANPDIDLDDDTTRRTIGRMVSSALAPLGYVTDKKSRLPFSLGLKKFKNAATFKKSGEATQRIEEKIVDIN